MRSLRLEWRRTRGTMAANHQDLGHALAHDKGNLSTSLANFEAKGLVTPATTRGQGRSDRHHAGGAAARGKL